MYFSKELLTTYYVGPHEYFQVFSTLLVDIDKRLWRRSQEKNHAYSISTSSAFNYIEDNRTEFLPRNLDHDTRSCCSAPVMGLEYSATHSTPHQIVLPEFSFNDSTYTPNKSLKVDGELSPIYSNVLEKSNSTVNIFSNGELSDYAVILKFKQIRSLFKTEANITVEGFLFNSCGWYVRYRGDPYSAETAKKVYNECISGVSFQHRVRISLILSDKEYIDLLIYVMEVSGKSLFDSNSM